MDEMEGTKRGMLGLRTRRRRKEREWRFSFFCVRGE